ncbi:LLM class flavin-dependent oxidoreductase [Corynebacterium terpenotabidum]|nr:LLM class flavin-dependent oxidoreductase [Corynebacterium terpenotabidum]
MTTTSRDSLPASPNVTLHWFLPTNGDSRGIVGGGHGAEAQLGDRFPDLRYLTQVAQAAEYNGFEAVLTPTGHWCHDSWLATSALLSATERLKFLVAYRPSLVPATLLAQQALTYQELSGDRLLLNVVVGGEDAEQRTFGDWSSKEERYALADEALAVADHLWTSPHPVTVSGEHLQIEGATLARRPRTAPPVFFGGSSPAGIEVAAKRADVYLTWGEHPDAVAEKLSRVQEAARRHGRVLEYGIRLHVISRDTEEEAWAEAQKLYDSLSAEEVARAQAGLKTSQSEGQRRMSEIHGRGSGFVAGGDARALEFAPGLWSGIGLVRGGAGTALVGSHDRVAETIDQFRRAGIGHFILSGYPHIEEAFRVGEGTVPALLRRGVTVTNHPAPQVGADESAEPARHSA